MEADASLIAQATYAVAKTRGVGTINRFLCSYKLKTKLISIPMAGSVDHGGGVRSLNLATAAGVVLFEALRQLQGP
mgnify:CR=1 FL=1